jgi:membrane-associated phospholipid phosphatase
VLVLFLKYCRSCLGISISAAAIAVQLAGISVAEVNVDVFNKPASEAMTDSGQNAATQPAQPDRITGEYVKGYFSDSGRILASPVNWDNSDWLKAALVVAGASGLYFADADIKDFSQRNLSPAGDKGAAIGNALGNPFYTVPSLGLFYLYGHFNEDPKARRTSLLAVESLAISSVLTLTIKMATQRSRPSSGEASTTWDGPGFKNSDPSFPSLHTTSAFSIAAVFAEEYGSNTYVPPLAYGLAALTGLSRVYDNKHWASDAFLGGAIGYFVGKAVIRYHSVLSDTPLIIMPTVTKQGFGVVAECRF